jgi:hypothetical protein
MPRITKSALCLMLCLAAQVACGRPTPQRAERHASEPVASVQVALAPDASVPESIASAPLDAAVADTSSAAVQGEADGNDDALEDAAGPLPAALTLTRVGKAPYSWLRTCDLTVHEGQLYAAHARDPLGTDGATVSRYNKADEKIPFRVAFDWNRFGEPSKGGGAGQGFLRIRRIDGRLYVPDADPPYAGLGLADWGTEGYVFVSDATGRFAPARAPHARPPAAPVDGGAGAGVVPRAYHVLDVVRFRGHLYTSTGSVPPKEKAWAGPSPGALHRATPDLSRWNYEAAYPVPYKDGVYRLTFLVRFAGKLLAGLQDYDGREPYDYVQITPNAGDEGLEHATVTPVRATEHGAGATLRWFADRGTLYWIASARDGVKLRKTRDASTWEEIPLPEGVGRPTDIKRFHGELVVLTERALVHLHPDGPRVLSRVSDAKTPFVVNNIFCAAPLAVYQGDLYAGGQLDGALYRFSTEP